MEEFNSEDEIITTVAENYLETPEQDLQEEFKALGEYNDRRFEDIPIPVEFTENDPYNSAEEMFERIESEEKLYVFNGGSSPAGMTDEQNLKGRAVHDYFGHYQNQCDFSMAGEFEKWYNQKEEVPDKAENLLFSEVVGQVALVHHLEDGFSDPRYQQREVLIDEDIQEATMEFYKQQL